MEIPSTKRQRLLCEILEISRLSAEGGDFSLVVFPEQLSLIETPLRGSPVLDIGVIWVRHVGAIEHN